jgi:predicted metal-binding membrane protein
MDRVPRAIVMSLITTSALAWIASINQPDMMVAMTTYNPLSISLFTASWTVGMAAMMFPAITPMILMYNRLVINTKNRDNQSSVTIQGRKAAPSFPSLRVILFVACYLFVWAVTGISLLLGWSVVTNSTIMATGNSLFIQYLYGSLLLIAGAYQFTPLKRKCIGYCESPMSFFMRRWRDGTSGAVNMGVYHGIYCLGCCWAYFLLMVALGWMNLLWMGLFAGVIFGEKMWSRGIWVAKAAGIALAITGVLVAAGLLPSIVSSATSMTGSEDDPANDMTMIILNNTANSNTNGMTMSDSNPRASMSMPGNDAVSRGSNNESDRMASDYNHHQTTDPTANDSNSNNGYSKMYMK